MEIKKKKNKDSTLPLYKNSTNNQNSNSTKTPQINQEARTILSRSFTPTLERSTQSRLAEFKAKDNRTFTPTNRKHQIYLDRSGSKPAQRMLDFDGKFDEYEVDKERMEVHPVVRPKLKLSKMAMSKSPEQQELMKFKTKVSKQGTGSVQKPKIYKNRNLDQLKGPKFEYNSGTPTGNNNKKLPPFPLSPVQNELRDSKEISLSSQTPNTKNMDSNSKTPIREQIPLDSSNSQCYTSHSNSNLQNLHRNSELEKSGYGFYKSNTQDNKNSEKFDNQGENPSRIEYYSNVGKSLPELKNKYYSQSGNEGNISDVFTPDKRGSELVMTSNMLKKPLGNRKRTMYKYMAKHSLKKGHQHKSKIRNSANQMTKMTRNFRNLMRGQNGQGNKVNFFFLKINYIIRFN